MIPILAAYIGEQVGKSLILYPLTWLLLRDKGQDTKFLWHTSGFLGTGIGAGISQLLIVVLLTGSASVVRPEGLFFQLLFNFVLPLLFAIPICKWILIRKDNDQIDEGN